jgi:hypothetical protein
MSSKLPTPSFSSNETVNTLDSLSDYLSELSMGEKDPVADLAETMDQKWFPESRSDRSATQNLKNWASSTGGSTQN